MTGDAVHETMKGVGIDGTAGVPGARVTALPAAAAGPPLPQRAVGYGGGGGAGDGMHRSQHPTYHQPELLNVAKKEKKEKKVRG